MPGYPNHKHQHPQPPILTTSNLAFTNKNEGKKIISIAANISSNAVEMM